MTVAENKGFHPLLEEDHGYIWIDSCMQAWPDADWANAHRHGVTAFCNTAWRPHATIEQALEEGMFWHLVARENPNLIVAETANDVRKAKQEGKSAFIITAQGGDWIGFKLHRIEAMYRLGLRMMLPAYNRTNHICDGCLDKTDSGLTRYGELVVDESNRVGLLLDCTHIGKRASMEIMERSSVPTVFSHSNPKAIVDNPRNIDDEQIKACIAKGGVIGVAPWGPIVLEEGQTTQPTLDQFIAHIDYIAQLAGSTKNIGLGTDMSIGTYPDHEHDPWGEPAGYKDVASAYSNHITGDVRSPRRALDGFSNYPQIMNVIAKLKDRGYSEQDVSNILGENYLRVFDQVWR
jgi:membrane dipeptidase